MTTVNPESHFLLFFKMELEDGELVESNFDDEPIEFKIGDGSLTSGMEDALIGKQVGESITAVLPPEMAFGLPDENNIHTMPVDDFPADMKPEVDQVIAFDGPDNEEILGTIIKVEKEEVDVDFSHPLAGRTITFTAQITEIL